MGLFDGFFKRTTTPPPPKKQHDFDSLSKDLTDDDEDVRERAAQKLGNLGDARAVKVLCPLIKDKDWSVRTAVVNALVKIGNAETIEPLVQVLDDEDICISLIAAQALQRYGGQDAQAALQRYKEKPEKTVEEDKSFTLERITCIDRKEGKKVEIGGVYNRKRGE